MHNYANIYGRRRCFLSGKLKCHVKIMFIFY
nr:MAG TPA: hypothetical protein [Caudoviricetes sp.]